MVCTLFGIVLINGTVFTHNNRDSLGSKTGNKLLAGFCNRIDLCLIKLCLGHGFFHAKAVIIIMHGCKNPVFYRILRQVKTIFFVGHMLHVRIASWNRQPAVRIIGTGRTHNVYKNLI